jgi:hypothetical protein
VLREPAGGKTNGNFRKNLERQHLSNHVHCLSPLGNELFSMLVFYSETDCRCDSRDMQSSYLMVR